MPDNSDWRWSNFARAEMTCQCGCGRADMVPEFMDKLQALRMLFEKPMRVTSAYRCPDHNAKVSGTGRTGPHTTGRAVDIGIRGFDSHALLTLAMRMGFSGVGVNQKGGARFLHLDDLPDGPGCPRPTVWSY